MRNYNLNYNPKHRSNNETVAVLQDDGRMIDWAERVNQQWQSQHALASTAERWMQQLQQQDRQRLYQGVHEAFQLMMEAGRGADLKKPFYRGLLSQATPAEIKEFNLQML